ncbi:beta-lactamase-like protein [Xylogone sp. PMI_703]|nr:beta-lactamase-like protein [Xylogone sp. PMI_703]
MAALPKARDNQNYVTVHALSSGFLTLPEHLFVEGAREGDRKTVPSISFLIQHRDATGQLTRIVFDMGIRKNLEKYPPSLQSHLKSRQPLSSEPDVKDSLELGGLKPQDIDFIFLSHVHWDHVGTPSDFPTSHFVVGHGAIHVLKSGGDPHKTGGHSHFEADLLPEGRTTELPSPDQEGVSGTVTGGGSVKKLPNTKWAPLAHFPAAIDLFGDGSVYIINAPGHLQGHVNLLARLGENSWVYLGGDACHDRRLLRKEAGIAEWKGADGQLCCIHIDKAKAEETIDRIGTLERMNGGQYKVEVVLAHDVEWLAREENKKRFWPGTL